MPAAIARGTPRFSMKIAVLLKYYQGEPGPFDCAALECALETGAEVTAVAMAPRGILPHLETLTRLGASALLLSDPLFAGSDTQATARVLSEALARLAPDFIFTGRQSMDGDTGQVPFLLGARLGVSVVSEVSAFSPDGVTTRSGQVLPLTKGTIYTFERIRTLRRPSLFSKKGTVTVWDNEVLGLDPRSCGLAGSPTRVIASTQAQTGRRHCTKAPAKDFDALIQEALKKELPSAEKTPAEAAADVIYYVGDIEGVAKRYAKEAVPLVTDGVSPALLAGQLDTLGARVVLFENAPRYKALCAELAVLTGAGVCADCTDFCREGDRFILTRPALGGNVMADIVCQSKLSLATVRAASVAGDQILFAVGKGATPYIKEIEALATRYGAEVVSSRIPVDGGSMPYAAQVGLTGRRVAPRVYVAFGVSGAVQHTCAIEGAGTVIAVNPDRDARIFDYADYGIVDTVENLITALT